MIVGIILLTFPATDIQVVNHRPKMPLKAHATEYDDYTVFVALLFTRRLSENALFPHLRVIF